MKTYVFVSQGFKIGEIPDKDAAIKIANAENQRWASYVERCAEDYEPYADNEVLVYEVIDGDEENSKLIWRLNGEVKDDYYE